MLDKLFYPKGGRQFHATCPHCKAYMREFTEQDKIIKCQVCEKDINVKSPTYRDYFVVLDVRNDLKELVKENQ